MLIFNNLFLNLICIQQTTKDGNFRGTQEFAHDVDVLIEVIDGTAYTNNKNRFGQKGELVVFESENAK